MTEYPYIRANAVLAGSHDYWRKDQSALAKAAGAPADAVAEATPVDIERGSPGIVNGWRTLAFYEHHEKQGASTMLGINATRLKQAAAPFLKQQRAPAEEGEAMK